LLMPRSAAKASSDVVSYPRVPKAVRAASKVRSLVLVALIALFTYQMVDNHNAP